MPELRRHFDTFAELGQDEKLFVRSKGATLWRPNFSSVLKRALAGAGLSGIHIRDLRHRQAVRRDDMGRVPAS
jgi:site-specific recombinase XerD